MKFTPRDYQVAIIDHQLDNDRGATWSGMGTGKSVSTLTAINARLIDGDERPTLIIAPLRVAQSTWPDECRKWDHLAGLRVSPIVGDVGQRRDALRCPAEIYTTNYENLPWLVEECGAAWPFATVVADESTKLKGFRIRQGGQRARALASVAHDKVERFVELTGTPSPNGLIDLWGQVWFIDRGVRLGRSYSAFVSRWFRSDWSGYGHIPLPPAGAEIQAKLSDICLSITAGDFMDLPPQIDNVIEVELPARARDLYRKMQKEMFLQIGESDVEAFSAAARTMKCLQLANGAIYTDDAGAWSEVHVAKLDALADVIEESAGMPVIVAYHFRSDLERLRRAFPKGRELTADPQVIRDWNAGRVPVLFAHPASAGHGLNLQDGGNVIAFFGLNWNLEEHLQIIERIGPTRQAQSGHNRPTFVHYLVARGTVDELVLERLRTKKSVQEILIDAMKRQPKD